MTLLRKGDILTFDLASEINLIDCLAHINVTKREAVVLLLGLR